MRYVAYHVESRKILRVPAPHHGAGCFKDSFGSAGAAKAAISKAAKLGKIVASEYAVAESGYFAAKLDKMVERVNLMSGKPYMESVNCPNYCSPASEAYWSM
jgi:hypothetical protein